MDETTVQQAQGFLTANSDRIMAIGLAATSLMTFVLARRVARLEKSTTAFAQVTSSALAGLAANQGLQKR